MIIPVTSESEWQPLLAALPSWQLPLVPTLVVAPHPDDETLGVGGMIAALRSHGVPVTVLAVTDGENAYAEMPQLGRVREQEQIEALERLGVSPGEIQRLRLTDSDVSASEQQLIASLLLLVSGETHIVAPWKGDFHPDHEVCGRAAEAVAKLKKVQLTSYFFWTWHRAKPELLDGLGVVSLPLGKREQLAREKALQCHRSQLEHESGDPILPRELLEPARRSFEVLLPS